MAQKRKPPQNLCGPRIKLARQRLGMAQVDLSAALESFGVSIPRSTIARIERGERNVFDYEVVALAQALEVDVRYLLLGGELKVD